VKRKLAVSATFVIAVLVATSLGTIVQESYDSEDNFPIFAYPSDYPSRSMMHKIMLKSNEYVKYSLNGRYYLQKDAIYASNANFGANMGVSARVTGKGLKITLIPLGSLSGSIASSLYAWIGTSFAYSTNGNSLTLSDIPKGINTLTIGGMMDAHTFAYTLEIDTSTDGEKAGIAFNSIRDSNYIGGGTPFDGTSCRIDHIP
jgi:hypothetical protein